MQEYGQGVRYDQVVENIGSVQSRAGQIQANFIRLCGHLYSNIQEIRIAVLFHRQKAPVYNEQYGQEVPMRYPI